MRQCIAYVQVCIIIGIEFHYLQLIRLRGPFFEATGLRWLETSGIHC
jgi:hypothetical protein